MFYIGVQFLNIFFAWKLTNKIVSYLVLAQLVLFLNLIGCLFWEYNYYHSHEASMYLVLFGLFFNLGALIANLLLSKKIDKSLPDGKTLTKNNNELLAYILAFGFFLFSSLLFFVIYGAPIFAADINIARVAYQKLPGANFFYRVFLRALPFTSVIFIFYWKIYHSKLAKIFVFVSVGFTMFILALLGFKGYVLWYCILLAMTLGIFYSNRKIIILGGVLLLLSVIVGIAITSKTYHVGMEEAFLKFIKRTTINNAFGYTVAVYEFAKYGDLSKIPSKETFNIYLVKWKLGENDFMAKTSRAFTITIAGTLIVFVKMKGMILFAFLFGLIYQIFYFLIFKFMESPFLASAFVYLTFSFVGIINRGLTWNYVFQPLLSLLIMLFCFTLIIKLLQKIDLAFFLEKRNLVKF